MNPAFGANVMGPDGLDPNANLSDEQQTEQIRSSDLIDPTLNSQPLEVYMYFAAIEREKELNDTRPMPDSTWSVLFKYATGRRKQIVTGNEVPRSGSPPGAMETYNDGSNEKARKGSTAVRTVEQSSSIDEDQKNMACRAMRTASWQAVFYLITTDILGFSSSPQAFSQLGYGPGVLVYTFFFVLALAAGQALWRLYMAMDSERFPVKCYADLGERTFGRAVRHGFNILQSVQILFNVAILIQGNGQTLASLIQYRFCFAGLSIFMLIIGMVFGQIRSLKNFAWFTNVNIWLNIITMVMTMIGIALYAPVPALSGHNDLSDPIQRSGWVPDYTVGWYEQVSGVQLAVFSYGGAMIFTEFMAEMRRPRDFWKAAFVAQLFCYLMYMFFGLFCYSYQGQYSSILPSLNFANQALSLGTNIIGLFTTIIASVLYGNIGIKVIYENVLKPYCKAPELISPKGRIIWTLAVLVYWALAWVIGSAIPNITALVTLIGAACILQFTYTFPPLLYMGHWMQLDAMKGDRPWEPGMVPGSNRVDTWRQASRWKRAFKPYWYVKTFLFLLFVAALALCGLGIYSGVEQVIASYAGGSQGGFSCITPGQT